MTEGASGGVAPANLMGGNGSCTLTINITSIIKSSCTLIKDEHHEYHHELIIARVATYLNISDWGYVGDINGYDLTVAIFACGCLHNSWGIPSPQGQKYQV